MQDIYLIWVNILSSVLKVQAYKHQHAQKDVNNTDIRLVHGYVYTDGSAHGKTCFN